MSDSLAQQLGDPVPEGDGRGGLDPQSLRDIVGGEILNRLPFKRLPSFGGDHPAHLPGGDFVQFAIVLRLE
ncbi:MAG: hypothetical protein ACK55I_25890, partial [bacterium]